MDERGDARDHHRHDPGEVIHDEADPHGDLEGPPEAARRPDAIICLVSALAHHGLTDEIPATLDVALPRGSRIPATAGAITWHARDYRPHDLHDAWYVLALTDSAEANAAIVDEADSVLVFDDVFVPHDRVFMAGETEEAGFLTTTYATHHRHSCIGARAGFGDLLIGAITIGSTRHVGAIRGLIQTRRKLGKWKERLMENPQLVMEAFVELGQVT